MRHSAYRRRPGRCRALIPRGGWTVNWRVLPSAQEERDPRPSDWGRSTSLEDHATVHSHTPPGDLGYATGG